MVSSRRFPPPWSIEEHNGACFIVKDAGGQQLAYFYFEDEPARRTAAKLLSRDEARRLPANFAKLPDMLRKPAGPTNDSVLAICERVAEVQALLHDHVEAGKHPAADVIAKAQACCPNPNFCGRCSTSDTSRRTRRPAKADGAMPSVLTESRGQKRFSGSWGLSGALAAGQPANRGTKMKEGRFGAPL
jgi:hypothetical protein